MKLSLCITNYNRLDMLIESFQDVLDDPRIDEVVISDDCSRESIWEALLAWAKDKPKVKLFRNVMNLGMSQNKAKSIIHAKNQWCLLLDSDNRLEKVYLDALEKEDLIAPEVIYMPDKAVPEFDYSAYGGFTFTRSNIKNHIDDPTFFMMLNTCNYVVNRNFYLQAFVPNHNVKESDTLWHAYNHLLAGGSLKVVQGMQYFHRVHEGSGWLEHAEENMVMANAIKGYIKNF